MKKLTKALSLILLVCMFCTLLIIVPSSMPVYAKTDSDDDTKVPADFYSDFGNIKVKLQAGFDFINTDSKTENLELALTGLTMSGQVYHDEEAASMLLALGYDYAKYYYHTDLSGFLSPTVCFGYKHLVDERGKDKNVFAIAVRGTIYVVDFLTDIADGGVSMFDASRGSVVDDFKDFLKCSEVNKTEDQLRKEDTYFFITGHSLGAAVANALSVDKTITKITKNDKGKIYTYTFQSPHTCINLLWMNVGGMSNAYNYKNYDDPITHLPPYTGSTTYGKDISYSVADLDYSIFHTLFPNAEGNDFDSTIQGLLTNHHDRSLSLVHIVQEGMQKSAWSSIDDIVANDASTDSQTTSEVCLKNVEVGDTVLFGHYEQDNNTGNGKEAIEWQVLDVQGGRALLISKYALDCKPYNEEDADVTWENCTLRSWLNGSFKNAAFTAEELTKIPTVTVKAHKNPKYSTNPGNATQDQIFLLSITEAQKYFRSVAARKVGPTKYANAQGAWTSSSLKTANGEATCWWWLRSPGDYSFYAAYVSHNGGVDYDGYYVYSSHGAVRPAMWVDLDALSEAADGTAPVTDSQVNGESCEQDNNTSGGMEEFEEQEAAAPDSVVPMTDIKVGDEVAFGHYEQDNNTGNGKEAIEWQVLDVQGDRALLISKYALDSKPYNKKGVDITWENCTLRSWLNNDFKNAAFTAEELAKIPTVTVKAHKNPSYSTNPGKDTQDQIFLLSITEAEQYFRNDDAMKAAPTAYAKAQGAYISDNYTTETWEATCRWWLRSPGSDGDYAARVYCSGGVRSSGNRVNDSDRAVRPALWVELDAISAVENNYMPNGEDELNVPEEQEEDRAYAKLSAPSIAVSNYSDGKIKVTWKAVEGATSYRVYRATSKTGNYSKVAETKELEYKDTETAAGKTRYYKVRAMNGETAGSYSKAVSGKVPEAKKTPAPTKAPTAMPTPNVTISADVCKAYLELLKKNKKAIDGSYQYGYRPVAIADICGDDTPELIFTAEGKYSVEASLSIYTYQNGRAKRIFHEEPWWIECDWEGSYLFQLKGDKTLYECYEAGDEDWWGTYSVFQETDSDLKRKEVCRYYEEQDYDEDYVFYVVKEEFYKDGKAVSKETYTETVSRMENNTSCVLLSTWDASAVKTNGCSAMSCDEAISFLQGRIDSDPGEASDSDKTAENDAAKPEATEEPAAKPAAPEIAVSNYSDGKVKVTWKAVEGVTAYRVYRATSETGKYSKVAETKELEYKDTETAAGKTRYYKVRAMNGETAGEYSKVVSGKCLYKPAAPTIKTKVSGSSIKISWSSVKYATSYLVYRCSTKDGDYEKIGSTEELSYMDSTVEAGKTYYYKVRGKNGACNGSLSKPVSGKVADQTSAPTAEPTAKPAAPEIAVSNYSDGKVKVTWKAVEGATSYRVYRSDSKYGKYSKVADTKDLEYKDTETAAGETRYYKLQAVNGETAGEYSKVVFGKCLYKPAAPTIKTKVSGSSIKISWSIVKHATNYLVYRSVTEDGDYEKIGSTAELSYTDSSAKAGKTYYYKVRAKNGACNGSLSKPVSGKVGKTTASSLCGMWSDKGYDGDFDLVVLSENSSTLEFYAFFERLWGTDEILTAKSDGDGVFRFDNGTGFEGKLYLDGDQLVLEISPMYPLEEKYVYTKTDLDWKDTYMKGLISPLQ